MRFSPDAADAGPTATTGAGGGRQSRKPDLLDLYAVLAEAGVEFAALAHAVYVGQARGRLPPRGDLAAARAAADRVLIALAALG